MEGLNRLDKNKNLGVCGGGGGGECMSAFESVLPPADLSSWTSL